MTITKFKINRTILFLLCSFFLFNMGAHAQEYNLTFSASGASTTLEKVLVENITSGTSILLDGSEELELNASGTITGINEVNTTDVSRLSIYPNPAEGTSTLAFNLPETGNTTISICDIAGKMISSSSSYLQSGSYKFEMPVLMSGLYLVSVNGKNVKGVQKLFSSSNVFNSNGLIKQISGESTNQINNPKAVLQKITSGASRKALKYAVGDVLQFTGTSGNASTIILAKTIASKNVDFFLINCIDADNNTYSAIKVGPLYWMATNLKTTKYNSGASLNYINSQLNWNALTSASESYCYSNDAAANGNIFGALYTYGAAVAPIVPLGWRLPSDAEFIELAKYLGGSDIAGAKLKAKGTTYWSTPNTGATNETGFNSLASGYRTSTGFSASGTAAAYWTSTKVDADNAYSSLLSNNNATIKTDNKNKKNDGLSIRCVFVPKDSRVGMMKAIFGPAADPQPPVVSLDTLPIPKKAFLMPGDKELMFMIPTDVTPFKLNYNPKNAAVTNIPNIPAATTGGVKWWLNLKKMTTQLNDNGHDNTIIAVWNDSVQGLSKGNHKVTLHIIGDSLSNYAHQTVVLPDYFTMPDFGGDANAAYNGLGNYGQGRIVEFSQHEFNLKTGDVNNDGTPDILIGVHDKLRIYDGKTFVKISEKSFTSDHNLANANQAFYLCFAVTDIDKNGKNDILVSTSSNWSVTVPKMHVFLNGNLNTTDLNLHLMQDINPTGATVNPTNAVIKAVSFAVGDINGDGVDEIVFHLTANNHLQYVSYLQYSNKSFTALAPLFQVADNGFMTGSIILARLKGVAVPYYIVSSNSVVYINSGDKLEFAAGGNAMIGGGHDYQVLGDQMVAGNFDKDIAGIEEVCYIHTTWYKYLYNENAFYFEWRWAIDGNLYLNYMYLNSSNSVVTVSSPSIFRANYTNMNPLLSFPVIAGVNTSHTGKILEFQRHEYMLTSPRVNAVLAAAPYYPEWFTGGNLISTYWGTSSSTGSGSATEMTNTASLIMGYEQEIHMPVIGTKLGGVEFTAKVSAGFSSAFSTQNTVTRSISYQSGNDDAVVVSSTPYDAYFYKILKSDNPEQEGTEMMISFPRKQITQLITVDSYNQYTEGQNAPVIDSTILRHTVGLPLTYPTSTAGLSNLGAGASFLYTGSGFTGVGNTGGVSQEIEISEEQSKSTALSISVEAELILTVGSAKLGAGYGFNNTNTNTTTIGKSTKVGGYVPGLNASAPSDIKKFNWNLVWYNYTAANQTFSVVNYLVQGQ